MKPDGDKIVDGTLAPLGYQQVNVSGVVDLEPPNGARVALIVVESHGVRFRDDGEDPTSSTGVPLPKDDKFPYNGDLTAIRFIAQSGTAVINVSYYG
jgi:hypothetical protein